MSQPQELAAVQEMAEQLIARFLPCSDWTFAFDHAKRRAGLTRFDTRVISLSRHIAPRLCADEVEQVLLHEIAHALAGPKQAHGAQWKAIARSIGYRGSRVIEGPDLSELAPWVGVCPAGHTHHMFRRPRRAYSCRSCGSGFNLAHRITWSQRSGARQ
jgi:SprT protein